MLAPATKLKNQPSSSKRPLHLVHVGKLAWAQCFRKTSLPSALLQLLSVCLRSMIMAHWLSCSITCPSLKKILSVTFWTGGLAVRGAFRTCREWQGNTWECLHPRLLWSGCAVLRHRDPNRRFLSKLGQPLANMLFILVTLPTFQLLRSWLNEAPGFTEHAPHFDHIAYLPVA